MIDKMTEIVKSTGKLIIDKAIDGSKGKWNGTQFKAKADDIAHEYLFHSLSQLEGIPIISEEDTASLVKDRPARYWLIDPIDGTASFVQGYSGFVTQIALVENNEPVMAAIYAPKLRTIYTAIKGEGAYHNGTRLVIQDKGSINSLIDNYPDPRGLAKLVYNQFQCSSYIECGSISLKICKVADGTADLFVKDVVIKDWDIAAPQLVLEEAGGCLTDIDGRPFLYENEYSKDGLVAAKSLEHCKKVTHWYNSLNEKEKKK